MKTALVLSGGGANGAYEAGALQMLDVDFDIVAGVSVGALNGVMVAQNRRDDLLTIWRTISEEQVFTRYSTLRVALRLLTGARSLYDLSPLKKLLEKYVHIEELQKPFYAGTVNMKSGFYRSIRAFATSKQLRDAVYASAIMPIVWAPDRYLDKDGYADGGLRNIAPLADVISDMPDVIYIICCQPPHLNYQQDLSFISIIKRTVEIFTSEIVNNDLDKLLSINQLVLQAREQGAVLKDPNTGRIYKYFKTIVIRPQQGLGDATDFSREHIQRCWDQGEVDAKAARKQIDACYT